MWPALALLLSAFFSIVLQAEQGTGTSSLFTLDTRYGLGSGSGTSPLFIVDTRSPGSAGRADSSVFTVDTRGAIASPSASVAGRVTDTAGNALSGATVNAVVGAVLRASATSDASGNYKALACGGRSVLAEVVGAYGRRTVIPVASLRWEWYELHREGHLSIEGLHRNAPMVACAVETWYRNGNGRLPEVPRPSRWISNEPNILA